ncbi:hypothetical protein Dimus_006976 [Dionaea muscipula]
MKFGFFFFFPFFFKKKLLFISVCNSIIRTCSLSLSVWTLGFRVSWRGSKMTQNGKLLPNLDQNSTKILNLTVLQRIDPCIEEILLTVAHVAFYEFNIDLNQWSRKDVEGSLFVVKRNNQPRFQFIVMNRRSTENLVENLLGDFEYEVQVPYLLYRNATQEVNGIWFYNSHECEEVANLFSRILNAYSKVPSQAKVLPSKSEFEELEGVPIIASMEGPLEPSSTSTLTDFPDESFTNFFNSGLRLGNNGSNMGMLRQPYHAPVLSSSSSASGLFSTPLSALQLPSTSVSAPIPLVHHRNAADPISKGNQLTNLVKPSSFFSSATLSSSVVVPSVPSSSLTIPLQPSISLQRPYGTPLLQPFPPPTPSPSLTPVNPSNYGPAIDRDKVREALIKLVQDNQFIDMLYQALQRVHNS